MTSKYKDKLDFAITQDRIISATFLRVNAHKLYEKLGKEGVNFIFKYNKPDMVIMTIEFYNEMMEMLEHYSCASSRYKAKANDDGKRYTMEEVFGKEKVKQARENYGVDAVKIERIKDE